MPDTDRPLGWSRVLEDEFEALRGGASAETGSDAPADRLSRIHQSIHSHPNPTSAVCLSGGGIRSGVFALGVLQGLAHLGALGKFDYLSTVSGGGYVGGWLTAWLKRSGPEGREATLRALDPAQAAAVTGAVEAPPVDHVRRTCRYLAPNGGASSADFWTLLATMGRNLLLNWLVILPMLAAALLIPRISYGLTETLEVIGPEGLAGVVCLTSSRSSMLWLGITMASLLTTFGYIALVFSGRGALWSQNRFLLWCLTPLVIGAAAGANFWAAFPCDLRLGWMAAIGAALPMLGWLALHRRARWRTLAGAGVSGALAGVGAYWFASGPFSGLNSVGHAQLYALLAVPFTLALAVLAMALFVGLASEDLDDAAIEWWSRCAAWIGLAAFAWLVASTLVFYLADALEAGVQAALQGTSIDHRWATALVSSLLPLLASLAGMAGRSSSPPRPGAPPSKLNVLMQSLVMPVIIVALLTSVAWVNLRAMDGLEYHRYQATVDKDAWCPTNYGVDTGTVKTADGSTRRVCHAPGGGLGESVGLAGMYLLFGLLMSYFVPVNRFSLHGMYRQRIVRTFLGASRPDRAPNPFTGFDGHDDLCVSELKDVRPFHVVCATLNAVSSTTVGRHEKQSQSFTFTPLHAGNREVGYRPAAEYGSDGGGPGTGLKLGTALAVSGAAASSAMGMYSSKARAFLLTLANARLGLWFGNPADKSSWKSSEPPLGVQPILRELLGLTTDDNPYVYLSDGGHYENLGLWEMVARRCHYIVVSDAGADVDYTFDSLSNAIRRIRLDLGIPIEFGPLGISKEGEGKGNAHAAVGVIRYSVMDGADAPNGTIVYLRAALSGDEPIDVLNFAKVDPAFPNDPTSDQFFDEARFESYRTLGFHSVLRTFEGFAVGGTITELVEAARTIKPSGGPIDVD